MKSFNKIAIIGLGLIGGSIGLAVKKKKIAREVIGVFRHRSTLRRALKCKAIDRGTMRMDNGVRDADLVIIATPVHSIPDMARDVLRYAKDGAIITDAGSTKKWIVDTIEKAAAKSGRTVYFVGSHPMAGSEHTGVEFSRDDLLKNAPCIVTKTKRTNLEALKKVAHFWKSIGAIVNVMSPDLHDRTVSLISHLPHIVAFSLAGAVPQNAIAYAAEGFRDTTRVASSDPILWADIFLTNKKEVIRANRMLMKYQGHLVKAISRGDYAKTVGLLRNAKLKRDAFIYGKET